MTNTRFYRNLLEGEITNLTRAHTALRRADAAGSAEERADHARQAKAYLALAQSSHERRVKEGSKDKRKR